MTWMMLEWGTFFMEMILIFLIPRPSLSFWVILKCLFCHSMVILTLNDLRVNKMMLEWPFSHPRMMINDSNEGEMMKFLKQGKCPRFFSSSFHPHFSHISSFDTHSMTEMSCHIGRQRYQVYAYSISHFNIIEHHFSLTLSSFIWWWIWTIKFLPYREAGVSSLRLFHFSFPHHWTSFQSHSILIYMMMNLNNQILAI